MSDFIINNSSISCIDLKINDLLWPNDYSNATNNYLRISTEGLLTWQPANSIIENDISSSSLFHRTLSSIIFFNSVYRENGTETLNSTAKLCNFFYNFFTKKCAIYPNFYFTT